MPLTALRSALQKQALSVDAARFSSQRAQQLLQTLGFVPFGTGFARSSAHASARRGAQRGD
jgi:hypothetical protein